MADKSPPLKLNPLQARTLAILQELARYPETSSARGETGEVLITSFPHAHGDHFHVGEAVVAARDATGLQNESVWKALERKGLARSMFPLGIALTKEGLAHPTGVDGKVLNRVPRDDAG